VTLFVCVGHKGDSPTGEETISGCALDRGATSYRCGEHAFWPAVGLDFVLLSLLSLVGAEWYAEGRKTTLQRLPPRRPSEDGRRPVGVLSTKDAGKGLRRHLPPTGRASDSPMLKEEDLKRSTGATATGNGVAIGRETRGDSSVSTISPRKITPPSPRGGGSTPTHETGARRHLAAWPADEGEAREQFKMIPVSETKRERGRKREHERS